MATIVFADIIEKLINNNGIYELDGECDPQAWDIWEYTTIEGVCVWHVAYDEFDSPRFLASPFVQAPRMLWSRSTGKVGEPTKGGVHETSS